MKKLRKKKMMLTSNKKTKFIKKSNTSYICVCLFFFFACCTSEKISNSVLLRADSLMECRPDSALSLLRSISQPREMKKADRAFYALLLTKAEDKNYIEHTSDSLIGTAFDYYQRNGTVPQKMEAWYYLASVYRDLGDAPRAIDCFQQAVEVSEGNAEHPLLSRIYSQMGTLYFYQKLPKEGVEAYKKSYSYALLANDSLRIGNSSIAMARAYTELGNVDSTLYYYKEAANIAHRLGNAGLEKVAQSELAGIYLQLDKLEEARRLLGHTPQNDVDYLMRGELYEKSGKADSARYAYQKVLEQDNLYAKRGASRGLYRLAKSDGREKEIIYCLEQLIYYKDTIQGITDTEGVKRIESLYAYQHVTNENSRLLLANKNKERIIFLGSIAFLVAISLSGYAWIRWKRQKEYAARLNYFQKQEYQKKIAGYDAKIAFLKRQLDQLSADNKQEKERVEEQLDKAVEEKDRMIASRQEAETRLRASTIYRYIHNVSQNARIVMTDDHWAELQREVDKVYNDFTLRLYSLHPRLKQHELRVCLLVKIEMANGDMAKLLCQEPNSISSIRARLFEKFHNKKGKAKDFDNFIRGL